MSQHLVANSTLIAVNNNRVNIGLDLEAANAQQQQQQIGKSHNNDLNFDWW